MSETELAIAMCPKKFGLLTDREREFWISRARIAINLMGANAVPRPIFRWPKTRGFSFGWLRSPYKIAKQDARSPQSILNQCDWYSPQEDGPRRHDGYVAKGTAAVWVYRAMIQAGRVKHD